MEPSLSYGSGRTLPNRPLRQFPPKRLQDDKREADRPTTGIGYTFQVSTLGRCSISSSDTQGGRSLVWSRLDLVGVMGVEPISAASRTRGPTTSLHPDSGWDPGWVRTRTEPADPAQPADRTPSASRPHALPQLLAWGRAQSLTEPSGLRPGWCRSDRLHERPTNEALSGQY